MRERSIVRLSLFSLCCFSLFAQQQQQPSANNHIRLDVNVTDKSGQPIPGLEQKDFTVLDNTGPQTITSFREFSLVKADAPVEILFVIDEANTPFQLVAKARDQLQGFLKQNNGALAAPASIVYFSDKGALMGPGPTRDGNALIAQMNDNQHGLRTVGRSQGFYGAVDRLNLSLTAIGGIIEHEKTKPGRKLVVWISPGWALLSGPRMDLTNKQQEQLFRTIVNLSAALREARITLYQADPIGSGEAGSLRVGYYKDFVKGVRKPSQTHFADLSLQVLATQSGGEVVNASNDVTGEIARCVADANTFYELTYDGPAADGPDDYHTIEVKIDRPGLIARTRTGYYAQPISR